MIESVVAARKYRNYIAIVVDRAFWRRPHPSCRQVIVPLCFFGVLYCEINWQLDSPIDLATINFAFIQRPLASVREPGSKKGHYFDYFYPKCKICWKVRF